MNKPRIIVYALQGGRVWVFERFSDNVEYWIQRLSQNRRVVGTLVQRYTGRTMPVENTPCTDRTLKCHLGHQ